MHFSREIYCKAKLDGFRYCARDRRPGSFCKNYEELYTFKFNKIDELNEIPFIKRWITNDTPCLGFQFDKLELSDYSSWTGDNECLIIAHFKHGKEYPIGYFIDLLKFELPSNPG